MRIGSERKDRFKLSQAADPVVVVVGILLEIEPAAIDEDARRPFRSLAPFRCSHVVSIETFEENPLEQFATATIATRYKASVEQQLEVGLPPCALMK